MDELRQVIDKLQTAADAINDMRAAQDYGRFARAFRECLSALKSAHYKLEGRTKKHLRTTGRERVREFQQWWDERIADPLIVWTGRVRDSDIHQQSDDLAARYHIQHFDGADAEPPPPGAVLGIGATGAFWVLDQGTARERRIPVKMREGTRSAQAQNILMVAVTDPPN